MDVVPELEWPMTAGTTLKQVDLWRGTAAVCEGRVGEQSIWAVLYHQGDRLFADELFADLFVRVGRRSVPPRIVATVMVLQRLQGCLGREAVEVFSFDACWKYACGGLAFDYPSFSHTVLMDMRARLAASDRPERIFEVTVEAARRAGLVGVRRVLDSTPLYDAVAIMDTVTLLGAAIRGLLDVADERLAAELRGVLASGEAYASLTKPQIDWDDQAARAALVDARARDAHAVLGVLAGRLLPAAVAEAARLLGAVVGQDLEQDGDGMFRIARKVAADRVISRAPAHRWDRPLRQGPSRGRPKGTSPKSSSRSTLPPAPSPAPPSTPPRSSTTPIPTTATTAQASFGPACAASPLRGQCTSAAAGRTITITAYEAELTAARARQADPDRAADYRATRPKVERKLAHLVRGPHGGRRVRVRGLVKVAADFNLLAAAVNLARLGVLGLHWTSTDGWVAA